MGSKHPVFGTDVPEDWQRVSVDDLKADEPSSCVAGPFGSNIASKYFVEAGVPIIRGSNLTADRTRFVADEFVFVSPERARSHIPQHVVAGDLVFTCWGPIGQVGLIPDDGPHAEYIISNKQLKLRPNLEMADPLFLFYYFASDEAVQYIRNRAIGAAVPGINLGILKALPVVLPPLGVQRTIVAVLAAYDDLIESNLRRIKLLEDMAQVVYREWFIELRYPGGGSTEGGIAAGLPDGWREITLGEADRFRLSKPRVEPYEGEKTYLATADCSQFHSIGEGTPLLYDDLPSRAQHVPIEHSVWIARMSGYQKVMLYLTGGQELDRYILSSGFACIECDDDAWASYIVSWVLSSGFEEQKSAFATGATQVSLTDRGARQLPVVEPPRGLIEAFGKLVLPMYRLLLALHRQNANLRAARDLLLPRLVSGRLQVADLDMKTNWLAG